MQELKNQKGFTAFELVLIAVALVAIGAAGYYAYQARQDHTNYSVDIPHKATPKPAAKPSPPPPAASVSDTDLIIAAVKAKGVAKADGGTGTVSTVTVESIVGDNAKGSAAGADPSGFEFIAHKAGGQWQVVYEGQQQPGSDIGRQYGLPSDWYSPDY